MHLTSGAYPSISNFQKRAFTIIELLVVILIIGLLTSVATASYLAAQKHARDSSRKSDINSIAAALETYYTVNHNFPGDAGHLSSNLAPPAGIYLACEKLTNIVGGVGVEPYYFYAPPLPTGPSCSDSQRAGDYGAGQSTWTFAGNDTWLPNLASYLNPIPVEAKFAEANGERTVQASTPIYNDVCDYLDSNATDACLQANNKTMTYIYRNLGSSYAVYARLESDSDQDFNQTFGPTTTTPGTACLINNTGSIGLPDQLSCVPTGNSNPIIIYMVRK